MSTLKEKMIECLDFCKTTYPDLGDGYVKIIANPTTQFAVPIKEVLEDGFVTTDEIYHPYIPFAKIDEELVGQIRKRDEKRKKSAS